MEPLPLNAITPPPTDPTKIFEYFRGCYATELLTAAVAHFDLFGQLSRGTFTESELAEKIGLQRRPAVVLFTALRAMGLLENCGEHLTATELANNHLIPGGRYDVGNYIGLAASSPGVLGMVELLRTNKPLDPQGDGAAFIYRDGIKSAMEAADSARHLTLSLSGRAKNVAPSFAKAVDLPADANILDLGGGTGIYAYALLQKHRDARATILDRPEVLRVAEEMAVQHNIADRVTFQEGDMFADSIHQSEADRQSSDASAASASPSGNDVNSDGYDVVLLSNILHDWDEPECRMLVVKASEVLKIGGQLIIHDVFLNDEMDGPLPIALYSASLFSLTEGRAYSAAEYRGWLTESGLKPQRIRETLVHCGVLAGVKE